MTTRQGGRRKAHFFGIEPQGHRLALQQEQENHEHVQYGCPRQCTLNVTVSWTVWYGLVPAWPARSLHELPGHWGYKIHPTSHLPKHKAGVIFHSPRKPVLQMMKQKNTARGKRKGDAFAFSNMSGAGGKHRSRGWSKCPFPSLCTYKASDKPRA